MTRSAMTAFNLRYCVLATMVLAAAGLVPSGARGEAPVENQRTAALPDAVIDPTISKAELELRVTPLTRDDLAAVAAAWLEIVKSKATDVTQAQVAIMKSEGAVEDSVRDRITGLVAERKRAFDNFDVVVAAWEMKGGEEAQIAEYRAYRNAIALEQTRTADLETILTVAMAWATARDGGVRLAIKLAIVVASLLALLIVARFARGFAGRWVARIPNLSKLLQAFLVTVAYWIVLAIGLMVVLSAIGIDISPVYALIGGASFILAFAFQDTLSNLASGLMIMLNRPFDEGDYVAVGGVAGTVKSVSIVATKVTTPDNQVIVIPNKNVWGNVITNVTVSPTRRVDLVFGIGYDDSIEKAQQVLEELVASHPLVLDDPAPVIRVSELAESSVNFIVRPWVRGEDYWSVFWDLTRQAKEAFDRSGIAIPYPQRDVHVHQASNVGPSGSTVSTPSPSASDDRRTAEAAGSDGHDDGDEETT